MPDRNVTEIDAGLSFSDAALAEPLAVAVRTVRVAIAHTADPAARIVILGGGAIGLLCALVLKAYGRPHIRIAEPNALRRQRLDGLDIGESYDPVAMPAADSSADIVLDAVGAGITRMAASAIVRPGESLCMSGLKIPSRALIHAGSHCRTLPLQAPTAIGRMILPRRCVF